jgi:hypothetical protein
VLEVSAEKGKGKSETGKEVDGDECIVRKKNGYLKYE